MEAPGLNGEGVARPLPPPTPPPTTTLLLLLLLCSLPPQSGVGEPWTPWVSGVERRDEPAMEAAAVEAAVEAQRMRWARPTARMGAFWLAPDECMSRNRLLVLDRSAGDGATMGCGRADGSGRSMACGGGAAGCSRADLSSDLCDLGLGLGGGGAGAGADDGGGNGGLAAACCSKKLAMEDERPRVCISASGGGGCCGDASGSGRGGTSSLVFDLVEETPRGC